MAISFVQYDDYTNDSVSTTIANNNALNTTTGNFLVAIIGNWDATNNVGIVTGVTDTAGNTYIKAMGEYGADDPDGERLEIWYTEDITGNASNITTATFNGSSGYRYISVAEFSGIVTSASLDNSSFNIQTGTTSHTSGNATASLNNELIIGGYKGDGSRDITLGDGFITLSSDLTNVQGIAMYKLLGASGDYAATLTTNANRSSIMGCAIFKPAAEPPGFTRKIKISGTFQDKPIKTKVGGVFVDKPIKIKVGGTFQNA